MISQIFNLLSIKLKLYTLSIILLMFLKGIMELVSISSIPFLIIYLLNPDKIINILINNNYEFLASYIVDLNLSDVLMLVVIIFILKNIFFFLIQIYEENFHYQINLIFRTKLFNHYLMYDYLRLIKNDISTIIRNISIEANFLSASITNIIKIIHDFIMIFIFLIFLTYILTNELIVIFLSFSAVSILIFIFLRRKLKLFGKISLDTRGMYLKNISDTFIVFKDITLNNLNNYFISIFKKNLKNSERVDLFSKIVFSSTKLLYETFAVILLCVIIYFKLDSASDGEEILAYLSIITILVIRMLPLFNTILSESNKLQFRLSSVKTISRILSSKVNYLPNKNTKDKLINKVTLMSHIYIKKLNSTILKKSILKNITLKFKKGYKIALVGASGSGKTTFLNHLSSLYKSTDKTIYFDKYDINESIHDWRSLISYMPQENVLINGTIAQNIALGFNIEDINYKNLNNAIKISHCDKFINKLKKKEKTFLGDNGLKLSGGQVQRLCLARSLYKDFDILILDEPTSSLDKKLETDILNQLFKKFSQKTIIISIHKIELIKKFDFVVIFDKGKIYDYCKTVDINKNKKILTYLQKLKENEKK